jgi:ABC-type glycerol-3-phosphate transport system substrate-binding protein
MHDSHIHSEDFYMFRKALRLGTLMLVILYLIGSLSACKGPASSDEEESSRLPTPTPSLTPTPTPTDWGITHPLEVWSYSDDIRFMTDVFMVYNPCVKVEYVEFSSVDELYRQSVLAAAGTADCPDVIVMDSRLAEEFVNKDYLLYDLSDFKPLVDAMEIYPNVVETGTNDITGEIRALSYQNTPGVVMYRRSLAREYFGTDDPSEIQKLMSDWDKFTEMAETVKTKSEGKSFMLSSVDEFCLPFFNNRRSPWIVDNKLTIDPMIDDLTELAFTFDRNGYAAHLTSWSSMWFEGMTDQLTDLNDDRLQVFCYFLTSGEFPTRFNIADNSFTDGDWACVPGPMAYSSGRTCVAVMKDSRCPELAKCFVQFCTLSEEFLTYWATGVYTQDYLDELWNRYNDAERVSPTTLSKPAGDFVSSQKVVESIIPFFEDSEMTSFLGGQNFYEAFATAALNCPSGVIHDDNERIQQLFTEAMHLYAYGDMSKEDMLLSFRTAVKTEFPEIEVEQKN